MRTTNYMACSLILAVLFLAAANVNAGLVTSQDVSGDKIFELNFTGDTYLPAPQKPLSANPTSDFTNAGFVWSLTPSDWDTAGYALTLTPPAETTVNFDYLVVNRNNDGPLYTFAVNGETFTNSNANDGVSLWDNITGDRFFWQVTDSLDGSFVMFLQPGGYGGLFGIDSQDFTVSFYGTVGIPDGDDTGNGDATAPEPATLAVLGLGLAGLGAVTRRRRKK